MPETEKIQYLVVDTSAFIRNAALQDIGVNIITEEDVVNEITNKRQLRRLVVLPYDLSVQNADPESVKFVTEFAKKTGDYTSLSATDVKVIALTYQLEKEKVGIEHLRTAPVVSSTVDSRVKQADDLHQPLAGFYIPGEKTGIDEERKTGETFSEGSSTQNSQKDLKETKEAVQEAERKESESYFSESASDTESDYETADSDEDCKKTGSLSDKFSKLTCEPTDFVVRDKDNSECNVDDILAPVKTVDGDDEQNDTASHDESEGDDGDNEEGDEDGDDDDSGWITPKNVSRVKKEIDGDLLEEKPAAVACLTMDFAMQNVLKQIGLNVAALDGRVIKQMRTFIFRCHACFKTTSVMTKVFCPSCGNKTLKKVAVSLDEQGNQQIHINFRRPISTKGKRFSLPMPRGGKHANNPILCEDQPLPDQRPTRLARMKNDPLQDDYIAGYSPFVMRDVYSKSAMLGIRPGGSVKYWMKKNPNETKKKRR